MDTEQKYVNDADFYVRLASEREPDFVTEYWRHRIDDPDDPVVGHRNEPLRDHHQLNEDVPIDGIVCFYFPDRLDPDVDEGPWSFSFPFRDHRKGDHPWFAFPDREKWERHLVWKWQNPEGDPHENLTLKPSLGIGRDDLVFHCYIRNGEIEWL